MYIFTVIVWLPRIEKKNRNKRDEKFFRVENFEKHYRSLPHLGT